VYRLTLDDATTAILYLWADAESYWPPSPTVPDDPFADASGAELAVVVVEPRVVGGQLLALRDIPHGHEYHVAREAHVRFAGVIEEQHRRLVLGFFQGHQVQVISDLDVRVLQAPSGRCSSTRSRLRLNI
jgi:hypothetical protein